MHDLLPEATQSTTIHIKCTACEQNKPLSCMHASTAVVFAPGPGRCTLTPLASTYFIHDVNLHEIFECAHLTQEV